MSNASWPIGIWISGGAMSWLLKGSTTNRDLIRSASHYHKVVLNIVHFDEYFVDLYAVLEVIHRGNIRPLHRSLHVGLLQNTVPQRIQKRTPLHSLLFFSLFFQELELHLQLTC